MKLEWEEYGDTTLLSLSGEFSIDQSDRFHRSCQEYLDRGIINFVIDLAGVTHVDSAALECLLWLQDMTSSHNGRVRIVADSEDVATVLRITRLDQKFEICSTVEGAARSLQ